VFRLGFGALPIATFERALDALADTCRSAAEE
jgi:DNA-binding transcriptional MocR family regulator